VRVELSAEVWDPTTLTDSVRSFLRRQMPVVLGTLPRTSRLTRKVAWVAHSFCPHTPLVAASVDRDVTRAHCARGIL